MAGQRGARNLRVFGSVARGEDTATSDVDLLVDLDAGQGLIALAAVSRELSTLLGVHVDIIPASRLKSAMRDEVLAEAVAL
ncbi:MAG: nucleotidyltransferase family protein [Acidimicrobiales bacterium]